MARTGTGFNTESRWIREKSMELGFSVIKTGNNHLKFTKPGINMPIFASSTPSCKYGHKKCYHQLLKLTKGEKSG